MAGSGTVTVLVTDLVGSVGLRQRLGDDLAEEHRRAHFSILRRALAGSGGEEVKNLGDGLMVAFPSAAEAVGCAVKIQQAVERHNTAGQGQTINVRVGINVGDATHEDDDYFGLSVDVAHRLCNTASGGQIIVSDLVRGLVGTRGGHAYRSVGPLSIKGLDEPVNAYEVAWEPLETPRATLPSLLTRHAGTPFVGRGDELDALTQRWKAVEAGGRDLVLISGEPGIGKTRLASEVCRIAFDAGATVLFGRCDEDAPLPYQPFVDALIPHLGDDPVEALRHRVGIAAGMRTGIVATGASLGGEDIERYRFYESIATLLDELAAGAAVVLVLDDIHWADRPTLAVLRHLLRRPLASSLLVIGTYRDTELGRTHPLAETLDALTRDNVGTRVALNGLREDDVAEMLHFIDADVSDQGGASTEASARAIHAETDGNPFFVEQVGRHLAETGGQGGIPQGVKDAIGRRLSRLSETCNEVLAVAAVIGREFDLAVLERVTARAEAEILAALDEARRVRVIDEVPSALDRWAFAHALLRETLHQELSTSARVRLHLRIGEAVEDIHADDLEPHLAVLAYHFREAAVAGHVDRAVDYAERAAGQAARSFAYEEVRRFYEMALSALDLKPTSDPRKRCELLIDLCSASAWLNVAPAVRAGREAVDIARTLNDAELFVRAVQAQFGFDPGTVDHQLIAWLKEALELLPDQDSGLRAVVLAGLASAEMLVVDADTRVRRAREAVDMARRFGSADERSFVLFFAGTLAFKGATREVADEILAVAGDTVEWRAAGLIMRIAGALREGSRDSIDADLGALDAIIRQSRSPWLMYQRAIINVMFALLEGDLDQVRDLSASARRIGTEAMGADFAQWVFAVWSIQEYSRLVQQGRFEALEPGARAVIEASPLLPGWRTALAMVLAGGGKAGEALELISSLATNDFEVLAGTVGEDFAFASLARAVATVGAAEFAPGLYRHLEPFSGRGVLISYGPAPTYFAGAIDHYLGMMAALMERFDDAERHFAEALAVHERLRSKPWTAYTRFERARMLLRRGDDGDESRARELAAKARADATAAGMRGLVVDIDALVGAPPSDSSATDTST